jgi:hypothetical protein
MTSYIEYVNRDHKLLNDINNLAGQKCGNSVNDEYELVTKNTIDNISFLVIYNQKSDSATIAQFESLCCLVFDTGK